MSADEITLTEAMLMADRNQWKARADKAEAEVARLREALEAEIKRLLKAGDTLSVAAQTTGGVAGCDNVLVAAINGWAGAKAVNRIIRLEGDGVTISAGMPDHPLRLPEMEARAAIAAAKGTDHAE